jgi:hypothetical protein
MGYRVPLEVQLNIEASAGDFSELAYQWLDEGYSQLCPDARHALTDLPARVSPSKTKFGPLGEPGALFGIVEVTRSREGKRTTRERNASAAGMRWLQQELSDPPRQASLWIGQLDQRGHRSGRLLTLSIEHLDESPTWLRLIGHLDEETFLAPQSGPATQQQWLRILLTFADRLNPGFGHLSYPYYGKTALEDSFRSVGYAREWRDHEFTVNDCRRYLRGYSWVTVVPEELATRVGGAEGLRASGAFFDVRPLAGGGIWLQATQDYRDFDDQALERVFETLAPILRPGKPMQLPQLHGKPPQKLVLRDAADVAKGL